MLAQLLTGTVAVASGALFAGPTSDRLEPELPMSALQDAATAAIAEWLVTTDLQIEFAPPRQHSAALVPAGALTLRLLALPDTRGLIPAHVQAAMEVRVEGRLSAVIPLAARIRAPRPVWVAARHLPVGHAAEPGDFRSELLDVAGLPRAPWLADIPQRHRLLMSIKPGQMLSREMLAPDVDVAAGDVVTLHAQQDSVTASHKALALQSGNTGDWLQVRPLGSSRRVVARVLARGTLEAR
ncbi:MAG: flagellar basal body P-ring formation protein FlgA [Burkholderiaceae bacterium]|nr:flagellar basal body P-ring formation protein FlgA [Burkholderiaceae bacterium]